MSVTKHLIPGEEVCDGILDRLTRYVKAAREIHRTSAYVYREYNDVKWKSMLQSELDQYPDLDVKALVWLDGFRVMPLWKTIDFVLQKVRTAILDHFGACKVCDLGAGSGYYTDRLGLPQEVYAGERSENGRTLCQKRGIRALPFDFNSTETYDFIESGTVILTMQAIEQLSTARHFVEGLRKVSDRIVGVVNMEPQPLEGSTPEQRLFNTWIEKNGYNQDLFAQLDRIGAVRHSVQHNMIGINPVNPVHLIVWSF